MPTPDPIARVVRQAMEAHSPRPMSVNGLARRICRPHCASGIARWLKGEQTLTTGLLCPILRCLRILVVTPNTRITTDTIKYPTHARNLLAPTR